MQNTTRRATPDDAAAAAHLWVTTWQTTYRGIIPDSYLDGLDVQYTTDRFRTRWTSPTYTGREFEPWVVERDNVIVGLGGLGPGRDDDFATMGELYSINVHPDAWGTGAGQALHDVMVDALAQRGPSSYLWTLADNTRAVRFYERNGWRLTDVTKTEDLDGFSLPHIRYVLDHIRRRASIA